jgi:hypothetical protein
MTLDPELWWGGLFNLAGDPLRAAGDIGITVYFGGEM